MSKKKTSTNKYLRIPPDFKGFNYNEVKVRRAMLEMKRDLLMMKLAEHRALLKEASPVASLANSPVGRFLGLGKNSRRAGKPEKKGTFGKIFRFVSMGVTAYGIYRNLRARR